jgi:1-acyl-sn-glycerol-3-phosphate acyltransferase
VSIFVDSPLHFSRLLLSSLGTRLSLYYEERIPKECAVLVVSNHRSFMDAPLLMAALNRPIRFACHHYMSQVPLLREMIHNLGCFPLEAGEQKQYSFFQQAIPLLQSQQFVGVFPEGTYPMVQATSADQVGPFQRGFAHLALRSRVTNLVILPVAIVAHRESTYSTVPLQVLRWFDPSEPLFDQPGLHPLVLYHQVSVLVGQPYLIAQARQEKFTRTTVAHLTTYCRAEIVSLLNENRAALYSAELPCSTCYS